MLSESSIILATDYSHGGDVVVSRPNINSASDLKGKTIGLQVDSLSLYVLYMTLKKVGLNLNDVKVVRIKGELLAKAFGKNKKLSAVVGWNPYAGAAIEEGSKVAYQ